MKNWLLIVVVCGFMSCKKEINDITTVKWDLQTATVNPAYSVNGKKTTDYKSIGNCLSGYMLSFYGDGTYEFSSSNPLCEMKSQEKRFKWTRSGDKITLDSPSPTVATIKKNKLTYESSFTSNNVNYKLVFTYKAR